MSASESDQDRRRCIRRALLGRGDLTHEDAMALQRSRGRFGRWHLPALITTALFWVAILVSLLLGHVSAKHLVVPIIFVVVAVLALPLKTDPPGSRQPRRPLASSIRTCVRSGCPTSAPPGTR